MAANGYEISTDPRRLDVGLVHAWLTQSYWSPGVPRAIVEKAIANSICFGIHGPSGQVGFGRVVSDRATFAYLADVFVLDAHRGRGLARRLMDAVVAHPDLQGLRRFMLATRDAHGLYAQYGFTPLVNPATMMEILRPDVYRSAP